jgi:hypothetical protein
LCILAGTPLTSGMTSRPSTSIRQLARLRSATVQHRAMLGMAKLLARKRLRDPALQVALMRNSSIVCAVTRLFE